jgi:hypothetical protein
VGGHREGREGKEEVTAEVRVSPERWEVVETKARVWAGSVDPMPGVVRKQIIKKF